MTPETDESSETLTPHPVRDRLSTPAGKLALGVGVVVVVLTVLLLAFGIWWPLVSLPTTASDTEDAVKQTILVFSIAAAPVMALVWGIAYYSLRHWRRGSGEEPPEDAPPVRGNNRVAVAWVVVSSLLTAFLLIWGLAALTSTTTLSPNAKPVTIQVTGQQWLWTFSYPDDGGFSSPELALPKDRPVIFEVTSLDVIHSFWLPEMGIKVDANPSVTTTVSTTPTVAGVFNVRCAELCGLNHSYMQTSVQVLDGNDWASWITAHGGTPDTTAAAEGSNG
ncbi:MAG: cytochrome c oxidase subunit II [Frankiales bacterium]|nr:cytochrome c oxidase subunit II [Frankiales bacterium]